MNNVDEAISTAIREAQKLRDQTRKKNSHQVRGSESEIIRATALAWFNNHRHHLIAVFSDQELKSIDALYQRIIEASHKSALRRDYLETLKSIRDALIELRSGNMIRLSAVGLPSQSVDNAPDFSALVQDKEMRSALERRWTECNACVVSSAPLAAIVMMGGLLEGVLLARIHKETSKAAIFTAARAPKDKNGKPLTLRDWTLQNYIGVAHELKWISQTVRDIGNVLRDYRNYIHPHKEVTEGVKLTSTDAAFLWTIAKNIVKQVLNSVHP